MTPDEIKALAAFLYSSAGDEILRYHAEIRVSGAYRLTSGSLGDVEVVDPRTLDSDVIAVLAALFDKLATDDSKKIDVIERIDAVLVKYVF